MCIRDRSGRGPVGRARVRRTGVHPRGPGPAGRAVPGDARTAGHRPAELRERGLPAAGRVLRPEHDARRGRAARSGWGAPRRGRHPDRPDRPGPGARPGPGPGGQDHPPQNQPTRPTASCGRAAGRDRPPPPVPRRRRRRRGGCRALRRRPCARLPGHQTHRQDHLSRLRFPAPATVETWVAGGDGGPVLVVMSEPGASLAGELRRLLPELRTAVGDHRRVLVGFDRGGWSPALFAHMAAAGFDVLTWRKAALAAAQQAHKAIATRIPLGVLHPGQQVLDAETKLITHAIAAAAFNTINALARDIRLDTGYARANHEAHTLARHVLTQSGDIDPGVDGVLTVRLDPMPTARATAAIGELCEHLTATQTRYPGTDLILRYEIKTRS